MSKSDVGRMYETARLVRILRDEGANVDLREMAAARLRRIVEKHWSKVARACRYFESITSSYTSYPNTVELERKRAAHDARCAAAVLVDYEILGP